MSGGYACLSVDEIRSSIEDRKTRVILAADLFTVSEISNMLHEVGDHICMLKTHVDGIHDFHLDRWMKEVVEPAKDMGVLLFEDRKFADIGYVSKIQMLGHQRIAQWADVVTAHRISGPDIVDGIHEAWRECGRRGSVAVLAQMSSSGNLLDKEYCRAVVDSCREIEGVCGFIGNGSDPSNISELRSLVGRDKMILTPGINLNSREARMGQRYGHPREAIAAGSDAVIVGSGIIRNREPLAAAMKYAEEASV
ncbi:MAG TPA: orotidine-5'-phosphate decarboxylase [Candidatus Thalassarchaeaceae archaeon]|nr:MAG TPA: orotidine-5'-phosphate decarboxylase [Candidatus Poseidoniales archaeon]HII89827.1 orotidine-5'-phosphate decarboxylase [Candidatus Thalassarchaeaceae archaeon]